MDSKAVVHQAVAWLHIPSQQLQLANKVVHRFQFMQKQIIYF
jgi:hypothetical protein